MDESNQMPNEIAVFNPSGELVSIPSQLASEALGQGYSPASPEQIAQIKKEEYYSSPTQQAVSAVEGAASAATFGLSTEIEKQLGLSTPEEILARREINPIANAAGQAAGLVASSIIAPGAGAAGVMGKVGAAAERAVAPELFGAAKALQAAKEAKVGVEEAQAAYKAAKAATPFLIKAGSRAANEAVQFGLMQAGDELSRSFVDPDRGFADAAADIGLAGILGGVTGAGLGAVSPLWEATVGQKAENFLNKVKARANGETIPIGQEFETVTKDIPPEVRAALKDPESFAAYQRGIESGNSTGEAWRAAKQTALENLNQKIEAAASPVEKLTEDEAGALAKESMIEKGHALRTEAEGNYQQVQDLKGISIPDEERLKLRNQLIEQNSEKIGAKGAPERELYKYWGDRILAQDTIGELDALWSELYSARKEAFRAGQDLKSRALSDIMAELRSFQDLQMDKQAMELAKATGDTNVILAAELAKDQRAEARAGWKQYLDKISDFAESLGIKKEVKGAKSLEDILGEIPNAKLADKMFDKKNIEALRYLKEFHPDVFETIVNQRKTSILKSATTLDQVSHVKLVNAIEKLPDEVRNLLYTPAEQQTIFDSSRAIRKISERKGPSGTALTLDTLWNKVPAGVGAMVSMMTGHNPLIGYLVGEGTKAISKDIPDAVRLSLMKFLGATGPVDASVWKSMVDYAEVVSRGQKALTKQAKNVFMPLSTSVITQPSEKDREKLTKQLVDFQNNPEKHFEVGGKLQHGMEDHSSAASKYALGAVQYLNALRPNTQKTLPLDGKVIVNPVQKAAYNRALDLAQKPLIVFESIKNGTVTPQDVHTLKTIFPPLYNKISEELTHNLIDHTSKNQSIPYKTRMGISMFLGQPLDSTMTAQSIAATQNLIAPQQMQGQTIPGQRPKHSFANLNKMAQMDQTPQQARISHKLGS